jgi:predicted metal-dependent phosphoesterase TrpH
MGTIVDMHVHTTRGASDSNLRPEELAEEALRLGLTGVHLSEHDRLWDPYELERFRRQRRLFVANGMEVSTDLGHILTLGLGRYVAGIRRAEELRRVVQEAGGYMIAAHPFRHLFDPAHFRRIGREPFDLTPEQAARLPVFELVDAVEALNGCNTLQENLFALRVAQVLGKPVTGGSDAHSNQGIGIYVTVFERELESQEQMLEELRAGRFYAAYGLRQGRLTRFSEESAARLPEVESAASATGLIGSDPVSQGPTLWPLPK